MRTIEEIKRAILSNHARLLQELADEATGARQISLPTLMLILLGMFLLAGLVIHAMGQPLICRCGYIKLWHGGIDDSQVSQHFSDWYSYVHVLRGITIYWLTWLVMQARPSLALGLLIAVCFGAVWEILENTPFIVNSYAKTTVVRDYAGDSVINSVGDMLATVLGVVGAARLPVWLTVILFLAGLFFPHDTPWIFLD